MQLKKIQSRIEDFKEFLKSKDAYDRVYLWDIQLNFEAKWDLADPDLTNMYNQSLQSKVSNRLWNKRSYEPKKMMSFFFKVDSDYTKSIFTDLFDEEKEIDGRLDRFQYYSGQLLLMYKKLNPESIENNHYQNHRMISFYLAMKYPTLYSIYDYEEFVHLLSAIGTIKIPQHDDFPRFVKIARTLYNFLKKDEELIALHQARFKNFENYPTDSLLLVYDYIKFDYSE